MFCQLISASYEKKKDSYTKSMVWIGKSQGFTVYVFNFQCITSRHE